MYDDCRNCKKYFSYWVDFNKKGRVIVTRSVYDPDISRFEMKRDASFMGIGRNIKQYFLDKKKQVEGMQRFYHGVRSDTDFIDIIECGHWKVDFLNKYVVEKGVDTQLAVDIVTLASFYEVALIISGDADSIPSINFIKRLGKQVGVVEFIKGYPPENRGRQFSNRLGAAADFTVQIYESDLQKKINNNYFQER